MIRLFVLGLTLPCLTACGVLSNRPAIEYRIASDLPDAALVQPCDTTNGPVTTNGVMAEELSRAREQRDTCARQVDGVREWRAGAVQRAKEPAPR